MSARPSAFHFNIENYPGSRALGKLSPQEEEKRKCTTLVVPVAGHHSLAIHREAAWQAMGLSVGCVPQRLVTIASLNLSSGSSPALLRFFYSVLSHSS